jgi:hypothetical protein
MQPCGQAAKPEAKGPGISAVTSFSLRAEISSRPLDGAWELIMLH